MAGAFLAACQSQPKSMTSKKQRSTEYFAESEYGVKASPRVTDKRSRLPRGGGRDQLGKPYKVKGKWYYPKEDRRYAKVGAASWYGDAFHGRLTANGEIYDMTHLTAAHPTMPLPSYARVTNTKNGASVIVRVNDRGPYSDGRIIDLSKKAAQMLDYAHAGVAKVKVEYVGRAPLDGNDERYLMASYRPNGVKPGGDPSDGLPTGVMIAMNGRTPSAPIQVASAAAFPGGFAVAAAPRDLAPLPAAAPEPGPIQAAFEDSTGAFPILPDWVPVAPERPADMIFPATQTAFAVMSYADDRVVRASDPFALLDAPMTSADIVASWERRIQPDQGDYLLAGAFESADEARQIADALSPFGPGKIERTEEAGQTRYVLTMRPSGNGTLDAALQAAWDSGAADAMVVRQ